MMTNGIKFVVRPEEMKQFSNIYTVLAIIDDRQTIWMLYDVDKRVYGYYYNDSCDNIYEDEYINFELDKHSSCRTLCLNDNIDVNEKPCLQGTSYKTYVKLIVPMIEADKQGFHDEIINQLAEYMF